MPTKKITVPITKTSAKEIEKLIADYEARYEADWRYLRLEVITQGGVKKLRAVLEERPLT